MRGDSAKTVLVVEDDPPALHVLSRQLTHLGYTVLWARDGWDALQILSHYRDRIDLVITDVVVPGLSGPALIHRARERHPDLAVIYVSGYDMDVVKRHGVDPDRMHFLAKPYEASDLRHLVEAALEPPGTEAG